MTEEPAAHLCTSCGSPVERELAYCFRCGSPVRATPKERLRQVATILNELRAEPMASAIAPDARASLLGHYTREMASYVAPAPAAAPSRTAAVSRPAPRPRKPMDWSWLADQQANLLLFAGAFLTIVAALIYVGYSEQAVSGALKMTLLSAYTLAFIAGGALCLRYPRVVMAGHVFLGVGAVMLPLNFAAARTFFGGDDLSAEAMWLAGSVVSGAFYAAVARIGLGRGYAVASGAAFVSAGIAARVAFGIAPEWGPIVLIATAALLLAPLLFGDDVTKRRIGAIWQFHAHIAALGAVAWAAGVAAYAADDPSFEASTAWFLPLTLAAFTAFAAVAMMRTRRVEFGVEAAAGAGGVAVATLYPFDAPPEAYAVALAAVAVAYGAARLAAHREDVARALPRVFDDTLYAFGVAATILAGVLSFLVLQASLDEASTFELSTRWYLPAAAALAGAFYEIDASAMRSRAGLAGTFASMGALLPGLAWAFDVRAEYYPFFLLAPALPLIAYVRWLPEQPPATWLDANWRDDTSWAARIGAAAGIAIALGAAVESLTPETEYAPQFLGFLPLALALGTVVAAVDASRQSRFETSLASFGLLAATVASAPYAWDADAAQYGAALAAAAVAVAAVRVVNISWLDPRARDGVAAGALVLATLPFEGVYGDAPRIGSAVHFVAALGFALAAIAMTPSEGSRELRITFNRHVAWLYASALALVIGYVFALRSLPAAEDAEAGSLAIPMALLATGVAALGAGLRYGRPEVRGHVYIVSLLIALLSLSMSPDALTLAWLLTAFVALYAALAVYENAPTVALPSVVLGVLAVIAWRVHFDAPLEVLPMAFAGIGVATYAAAIALTSARPEWSVALRVAGASYALIAPAAGFAAMAVEEDAVELVQTPLYQWTTLAVAVAGGLAVIEAALSGRRWIIVPASATLVAALLLQIARFEPQNEQAYTLVIGVYVVLLGAVGISRYRLVPGMEDSGTYLEALGAATIMFPSFLQSLDGGWTYQLILFAEAIAFVALAVAFRRHGILSAALGALVLVAGRAIFDTINALPNWIVASLGGALLLAAGMAVLLARDRWTEWQEAVIRWWTSDTRRGGAGHTPAVGGS